MKEEDGDEAFLLFEDGFGEAGLGCDDEPVRQLMLPPMMVMIEMIKCDQKP